MKKTKRILALAGAVLLVILYAATLIFALIDSPWAYDMFKICLGMTIILPVLLYAYNLMYRVLKHDDESGEKSDD
ncbi:MAG: hypothetical protein ACLU9Q_00310 [Marvinbryantia sp.]|uniref:hypothetical protein n=1 Tax=Marvinbryantia sp. TaxID=2496532 RepID=UPI0025FFB92F|nr:hypothetical protein [uncultured Marvinbryantia sp.]